MKEFNPAVLRSLRQERQMSLAKVSEASGGRLHRQMIYVWEHGKSAPSSASLAVLADVFGVSMESFFVENDYHGNNSKKSDQVAV